MPSTKTKTASTKNTINPERLHGLNLFAAGLNLLQGLLILLLSNSQRGLQPISIHYLSNDRLASAVSGRSVVAVATRHLYDLNLAYVIAAFFFIGALAHLAVATFYRGSYEAGLKNRLNKLRWGEYALTGGLMVSAIAMLSGLLDVAVLVLIFLLTVVASVAGWAVELHGQSGKNFGRSIFNIGAIAGAAPWLAFIIYIISALSFGGNIPTFVYFIYLSMFILAGAIAANLYLQQKKPGNVNGYLMSERNFILLSLVAKAALAWQIFFGTLR